MGYRKVEKRYLWEIYRRWQAGQSVSRIAANERWDRKTIRRYLKGFQGLELGGAMVDRQRFQELVEGLVPEPPQRPSPAAEQPERCESELRELINQHEEPLKPKTAFLAIREKYALPVSYESFKRFARARGLDRVERRAMIRIELPPGLETQLDYGKVGMLADVHTGGNRVVWAFCGVLAYSRLPYIEFVWTQDRQSFVASLVSMLENNYGGATELLASVMQPHAYLNARRARGMLGIMAAHYGKPYFEEVCQRATRHSVVLPTTLKRMLETAALRPSFQQELPLSQLAARMVRDARYYTN